MREMAAVVLVQSLTVKYKEHFGQLLHIYSKTFLPQIICSCTRRYNMSLSGSKGALCGLYRNLID